MGAPGSTSPVRANEEITKVLAIYKGGGDAADLVVQTTGHKCVKAFVYNAATGTYQLQLWDWPGTLIQASIESHPAAGASPQTVTVDFANVSKTAYTIPVYVKTLAGAAEDVAATTYVTVELTFQKSV